MVPLNHLSHRLAEPVRGWLEAQVLRLELRVVEPVFHEIVDLLFDAEFWDLLHVVPDILGALVLDHEVSLVLPVPKAEDAAGATNALEFPVPKHGVVDAKAAAALVDVVAVAWSETGYERDITRRALSFHLN